MNELTQLVYRAPRQQRKDFLPLLPGRWGAGVGFLLVIASVLMTGCGRTAEQPATLRVLVAASLEPAMQALRPTIEDALGVDMQLSAAGSGTLTRQLEAGVSADAVVLAHPRWMDRLVERGRVEAEDRVDLLTNSLVVVGPADHEPITLEGLAGPGFARVAIGDPDSVPAGQYARQALVAAGLWDGLADRLVYASDVRAALGYAEAGQVDAALVYASDAVGARSVVLCTVPAELYEPIVYPAAALDGSVRGRSLVTLLQGEAARGVFESLGLTVR